VSTQEQSDQQTIETQVGFAERWADLYRVRFLQVYRDEGISGTVPMGERPAGARLLADLRAGSVDAIHVYRVDRLARRIWILLETVREVEAHGGKLVSLTESFDTGTPVGRLLLTLLGAFAEYERESIAERTREGHRRLSREGCWVGGPRPPYGYRVEDRRLVPSETPIPGVSPPLSEAGVVQLAFHLLTERRLPCGRAAAYLNSLGLPPAKGGPWSPQSVRHLITNSTYRGLRIYGKRTVHAAPTITQPVPPLVTEAQWQEAQAALLRNRSGSRPSTAREYLLRGLLVCGVCGRRYLGVTPTPPRWAVYSCARRANETGSRRCSGANLPLAWAEAEVWERVRRFLEDPDAEGLAAAETADPAERIQLEAEARGLEGLLREKDAERARVVSVHRRGRIDDAGLDRHLDEIEAEEVTLRSRRREVEGRLEAAAPPADLAERRRALAETVREKAEAAAEDFGLRQEVLRELVRESLVEAVPGERLPGLVLRWRV
jgi:site-specific DNA recombinase